MAGRLTMRGMWERQCAVNDSGQYVLFFVGPVTTTFESMGSLRSGLRDNLGVHPQWCKAVSWQGRL